MKIQWMWEKDDSSGYIDYDPDITNLLELIYSNCAGGNSKNFVIPYKDFRWRFDFNEMTQKNEKSGSKRKIIRVENGKVWIFYQTNNRKVFTIINPQDYPIFGPNDPDGWSGDLAKQYGYKINRQYNYDKNGINFTCDINELREEVICDNGYTIEKVTLTNLQSLAAALAAARAAPQYQPQLQYPSQAAAAVTQQQSPLPAGWIEQRSPEGIPFYVHTPTAHTTWDRPLPSGWIEKIDTNGRKYYENLILNQTQWTRPQGGGKTGKKKKRIIKRQKTYKNKRYTKRKTIKR